MWIPSELTSHQENALQRADDVGAYTRPYMHGQFLLIIPARIEAYLLALLLEQLHAVFTQVIIHAMPEDRIIYRIQ